jgi:hypothetical protein
MPITFLGAEACQKKPFPASQRKDDLIQPDTKLYRIAITLLSAKDYLSKNRTEAHKIEERRKRFYTDR